MKISIITVNLNNRVGLEKTMGSVLSQTFTNLEYLVIDGGSSDGSVDVIDRHAGQLAYWISEPDRGVYHAMNKGIEKATGEYLLFLNSGDLLLEEITLSKASIELDGVDIIYGNLRYNRKGQMEDSDYPDVLSFGYLHKNYLPHPATFIKNTLFERTGNYDERFPICADWVFFLKAIGLSGATYKHIHQPLTIYDTEGMSAQSEQQQAIEEERGRLLQELFPFYIDDYRKHAALKASIEAFEERKSIKFLKKLGIYKSLFQ